MSDKNYAYLYAAEKAKRVAWAFVLHQKIMSEIREKDKRKVHKTSRLGPVLAALFMRITNLEIMFGDKMQKAIKPFSRTGKRPGDMDEDEPLKSKHLKTGFVVDKRKVVRELQDAGYIEEKAVKAVANYKAIKDPLFAQPFGDTKDKEASTPSSSQKKGLKLKIGRTKMVSQLETGQTNPAHFKLSTLR